MLSAGGGAARAQPPGHRVAAVAVPRDTILIGAADYAFVGVPPRVPAGWLTLRMVNRGRELHMLGIGRVPTGHSAREIIDDVLHGRPAPETADWGGPNVVGPGDTATVSLEFPPGEYVVLCAVESADGRRHFTRGMAAAFEAVAATGPAARSPSPRPAHADALVTLTDYHVTVRDSLPAGSRTLRVRNAATQGHDLEILELLPGRSVADALRWFEHPAGTVPPARAVGGVVAIHPGQEALVTATLRPGRYVFLCWVPDAAGQPHFRRGMWRLVDVRAPRAAGT